MLILLPPSEGKAVIDAGDPVDLASLSFPMLTATRERLLRRVDMLTHGRESTALRVLGLSRRQLAELERDQTLLSSPAAPAAAVYTGVLYEALDLPSLPAPARRRVDGWVVVTSALWGAVRLTDRIPAYRLSGDTTLPRLGKVSTLWRRPLATVLSDAAAQGVVLDLRSSTYAAMWQPTHEIAERTVTGRVLQRRPDGSVQVVSHHNKATKGRLVAALARAGRAPSTLAALAEAVVATGAEVDLALPVNGKPGRLDIITGDL